MARRPRERGDSFLSGLQQKLDKFLDSEIDIGSFPGAVYVIGDSSEVVVESARGHAVIIPAKIPVSVETIYDVASLTKPLITATIALLSAAEGKIDLNDALSMHVPELGATDKKDVTFIDLLTHRGGFQAWYPLYTQGLGKPAYFEALLKRPLRYRPGTREIYSCLGFILLMTALERVYGAPIEDLANEKIFAPLGLSRSLFSPPPEMKYVIAATEWGNSNERQMVAARSLTFPRFRNYMICGEVDD
ncbi:MAG TPA: serine hydrolase domain-containing protein, partial [Thermoanaerobaculia bacterium]